MNDRHRIRIKVIEESDPKAFEKLVNEFHAGNEGQTLEIIKTEIYTKLGNKGEFILGTIVEYKQYRNPFLDL